MLILHEKTTVEPLPISNETAEVESSQLEDSENNQDENGVLEEVIIKACENATNSVIQHFWDLIADVNSLSGSFDYDYKGESKDSIKEILESVVDDLTVDIGMLYKVVELLNSKTTDLIDAGEEKAEEIIQSDSDEAADELDAADVDLGTDETAEEEVEDIENSSEEDKTEE